MSTSSFRIESTDLTIEQIFKDFYSVPDFQREYVWQTENVEKLLQDIFEEFYDEDMKLIEGPEYFLGSVVVCKDEESIFQLIDGQQRMTTIYLILCAARDLLVRLGKRPTRVLSAQISDAYSDPKTGDDIERHRLTLQYEDSDGILEKVVTEEDSANKFVANTQSVEKILNAYNTIRIFLEISFRDDDSELKKFLVAFTTRIKLIRILTPSIANALKVFETINDRGVGLNAMDLLKNLLFMKTESKDYIKLKTKWKQLVDTLDGCAEKPLRFLRYYIMSHHEIDLHKGIREDQIYDWFVSHTANAGIDDDPLKFLDSLILVAKAHSNFLNAKDVYGNENRYLKNISLLGGAIKQQHILLLAGMHLREDLFNNLVRAIENLFFCYIITREPTKTFERNFAKWSKELRDVDSEGSLDTFLNKYFYDDMRKRSERFDFSMKELTQNGIQQYRMRYILAKLTQFVEELAWGNPQHGRLELYVEKNVEIEHILPKTPTDEVKNSFDIPEEYDEYKVKLGNLTLLEKTINSSISNGLYTNKISGYKESSFLLTKSLAEKPSVGSNTQLNRAVAELESYTTWNSANIISRQELLAKISRKVWGMPEDSA